MKKLGVVITDGVGFRNFILSDFIAEAKKEFSEIVIYSCLPVTAYEPYNLRCDIIEMGEFREGFVTWFFRKMKEVAHLEKFRKHNFGINDNYHLNKTKSKTIRGFATRIVFLITPRFHSEKWILRFNTWQQWSLGRNSVAKSFKSQLQKDRPDLLFFTHQRPPFIAPLILQAEKLKIKTASFIFSWDNLASKGRMSGNFDFYLVWSDLMRTELTHFYESIPEKNIKIVGTPQFEPYILDRYRTSREAFFTKFNLDPELPVIVFTCNDSSSKNDPYYLEILAGFIADNQLKANLLVRTSPADEPRRFLHLKDKFPFIRWNFPEWILARQEHSELWTQRIPTFDDVTDFKSILQFCDVLINVLSTTILDVFLFDKPSICPVFAIEEQGLPSMEKFLYFAHLKHVEESNAVAIVKNRSAFLPAIQQALEHPFERLNQQKELVSLEIGAPLEGTSKRIAKALNEWS